EGPEVRRVQRIAVGEDATAHLIEEHVGKMARIAQRFGGSLETVRRADNALQVLSASGDVSLHQPPQLRRCAQELIEFDHVRWAAVDVGDNQPIGGLSGSQAQLRANEIGTALGAFFSLLDEWQASAEALKLNRRKQDSATLHTAGPYRRGPESFGRLWPIDGNRAEREQAKTGFRH